MKSSNRIEKPSTLYWRQLHQGVFVDDLGADEDENDPAEDLYAIAPDGADPATDVHPKDGKEAGDRGNDESGCQDCESDDGQGEANGKRIDAGGNRQEDEVPPRCRISGGRLRTLGSEGTPNR